MKISYEIFDLNSRVIRKINVFNTFNDKYIRLFFFSNI